MNKLAKASCFVILLLNINLTFSQANFLQWVKAIGSVNVDNGALVRVDDSSNVFLAGTYYNTIDVDPGTGVVNLSVTSPDTYGNFIAKYDKSGNFKWAKAWRMQNRISDFEVNSLGRLIVGMDSNGGDVDPGAGTSAQNYDGVLVLSNNGLFVNFYGLRPTSTNYPSPQLDHIALDKSNNILVSGQFGGFVDFDPSSATNTASGTNYSYLGNTIYRKTLFCWKLKANGSFVFVKNLGTNSNNTMQNDQYVDNLGIEADSLNAVYTLTKNYTTPGGTTTVNSHMSKFDSLGTLIWTKTFNAVTPFKLAVGKGVYLLKNGGTYKFDFAGNQIWDKPGFGSIFLKTDSHGNLYTAVPSTTFNLAKCTADGIIVWQTSASYGNGTVSNLDFAIDKLDNVYFSGSFLTAATFVVNGVTTNFTSIGGNDYCFGRLSNCIYDAPNICLVTVDSLAQNNVIYWDETPFANADSFIVYRYDAFTTNYLKIGTVAKSSPNNFLIDTARSVGGPNGGDPQYSSYRYKLAIKGTCGAIGTKGLYHESIFIQQNNQNFSWNAYGIEGQTSPATGYQFMRDNTNTGNWQVLVNTGGLSTTDPNYATYPNGNWRVDALGFSCVPNGKYQNNAVVVNRSKSNVKNNKLTSLASQKELSANLSISPNPVNDELTIKFSNTQQIKTEIEIIDVLGKVVRITETYSLDGTSVNLSGLDKGVYFLVVKQGKISATKKFIKE